MYLVFDIGGTFVKYAIMNDQGDIVYKNKIKTITDHLELFITNLVDIYNQHQDVKGIAISAPGLVDIEKGIIYGGGAVTCLDQVPICEILSKQCHNIPVTVENDGKCAGLAEAWIGAAKDVDNCCVLAFGTGVAGAIIKDKKIHRGNHLVAGEASYFIQAGNRHELKTKKDLALTRFGTNTSTIALVRRVKEALNMTDSNFSGEQLFELAHQGNQTVLEILEDFYFEIAIQCVNLQYVFDPDVICIGGGISEQDHVIEGIKRNVDLIFDNTKQFIKPQIVVCQFNNDSNLIGALYHFKQMTL